VLGTSSANAHAGMGHHPAPLGGAGWEQALTDRCHTGVRAVQSRWASGTQTSRPLGERPILVSGTTRACCRSRELLTRVIEASAQSTFTAKIDALGRVLANRLQDDGDTAEALILARALEVLDEAHVVVLDHLKRRVSLPHAPRVERPVRPLRRGLP